MKFVAIVLFLAGCTPEARFFTPRPAAQTTSFDAGPNRAEERDQHLEDAVHESVHIQEILDEPVKMQGDDDQ